MPEKSTYSMERLIQEITLHLDPNGISKSHTGDLDNQINRRLVALELLVRSIIESSLECIFVMNNRGEVMEFNPAAERKFGLTRIGVLGRTLADLIIPPRLRDSYIRVFSQFLTTNEQPTSDKHFEFTAMRSDHTEFPIELTVTRLLPLNPPILFCYLHDLSQRKSSEQALEKAERRFQSLIEKSFDMIAIADSEGYNVFSAGAVTQILGITPGELLGKKGFDITYPPDVEIAKATLSKILQRPSEPVRSELRLLHKDGLLRWVEIHAQNFLNDPAIAGIVVNLRDITERKRSEEVLRKAEEKYRTIVEESLEGIFQSTPDGQLLMANPAFAKIYGYDTPDELMAMVKHVGELYVDPESRKEMLQSLSQKEALKGLEARALRKDGKEILVSANVRLVRDFNGKVLYLEGRIEDITEQRELEHQVLRAQKLESLGILAGGIAHDFNNILTAILGNISLAQANVPPAGLISQTLLEAERASLRAKDLANQLLTFAKGGAPRKSVLSIQHLLKESVEFVLRGTNVRVQFVVPDDIWPLEVDEGQISQVIQNLAINAIQSMPEGGFIKIRAENCQFDTENKPETYVKPGAYVKIQVRDSGTGIPENLQQKIFDPYFTTKPKGYGLGLAISYSIIKKHAGYITVQSEAGLGSTFTFYLPSYSGSGRQPDMKQIPLVKGKGHVLIMDDDESVLTTVRTMLEFLGYGVTLTIDGREAIIKYKHMMELGQPYDLVILDLTVPGGMGGQETIRQLIEINPQVKGLVSSGYSDNIILSDYHKFGFAGVVTKPSNVEEISQAINNVLNPMK
ncbi:MAG: PAS domain S-box protein [Nitrospiria bacterium]